MAAIGPIVDTLPVWKPVDRLTNVVIASFVGETEKPTGICFSFSWSKMVHLAFSDYMQRQSADEVIDYVMTIGSHPRFVTFNEYTENTFSIGPLTYPTIVAIGMVATPSEENVVTCVTNIATTDIAKLHRTAIRGNDMSKNLLHIVRGKLIGFGMVLCAKGTYSDKKERGKKCTLHYL